MISQISIQSSNLLLLFYYHCLLSVVLFLKIFLHLAHYLRVLKSALFFHIKLPPQLNYLVLFDKGMIVENLSELFLVLFEFLCVFLHLLSFFAHFLDLVV